MTKRRMMVVFLFCFSIGGLARMTGFQACSLARDSGRSGQMSEAQMRREFESRRRQRELERRRKQQERRKESAERKPEIDRLRKQRRVQREQARKEKEKEIEKDGGIGCYVAKRALEASEERWELIQPKLKKVENLRDRARSTIGAGISDGSSDSRTGVSSGTGRGGPKLQWERPWKGKSLNELTEAQRLARHLRILLERKDTTPQAFRRKIADLRKARSKDAEIEKQLAEARRELRAILTTSEEAVLVLKQWL